MVAAEHGDRATLLLEAARRGELHHSIILHGSDHETLVSLATRLAKTLICENGSTGDDCNACSKVERELHPDVRRVSPADGRKMIAVEQIREIVNEASLRPYEAARKVFIIDPVDLISVAGANAMLKTLEEPQSPATFLLLTRSADLLLPTIRSRSQSIEIRSPAAGRLTSSLFERAVPSRADAGEVANEHLALLARAATGESAALLKIAGVVGSDEDPNGAIAILVLTLREIAAREKSVFLDEAKVSAIRAAFSPENLLSAANELLEILPRLVTNADVRLLVESALARVAGGAARG